MKIEHKMKGGNIAYRLLKFWQPRFQLLIFFFDSVLFYCCKLFQSKYNFIRQLNSDILCHNLKLLSVINKE